MKRRETIAETIGNVGEFMNFMLKETLLEGETAERRKCSSDISDPGSDAYTLKICEEDEVTELMESISEDGSITTLIGNWINFEHLLNDEVVLVPDFPDQKYSVDEILQVKEEDLIRSSDTDLAFSASSVTRVATETIISSCPAVVDKAAAPDDAHKTNGQRNIAILKTKNYSDFMQEVAVDEPALVDSAVTSDELVTKKEGRAFQRSLGTSSGRRPSPFRWDVDDDLIRRYKLRPYSIALSRSASAEKRERRDGVLENIRSSSELKTDEVENSRQCQKCKRKYRTERGFSVHQARGKCPPFTCMHCHKNYSRLANLRRHRYRCKICE